MEFNLTVDLDKLSGENAHELSRILRYWAGALKDADLAADSSMNVYDSHYSKVGRWSVTTTSTLDVDDSRPTDDVPETAAPAPTPDLPETPGEPDEA